MKICGVLKQEQRHWYLLQSQFKYRRNGKNINIQEGREFGVVLGLLQQSNVNDYSGQLHKLTVCRELDTGDLSSFVNFSHLFPEQHWGLEELAVETSACLMFQNWTRNTSATLQLTSSHCCNFLCNFLKPSRCIAKQQYAIWPWPAASKTKLNNNLSHKAAISVQPGHILQRKCPLVFPLMSFNCSASTLWFTEVPESNMWAACRLKLQQQVVVGDSSAK